MAFAEVIVRFIKEREVENSSNSRACLALRWAFIAFDYEIH